MNVTASLSPVLPMEDKLRNSYDNQESINSADAPNLSLRQSTVSNNSRADIYMLQSRKEHMGKKFDAIQKAINRKKEAKEKVVKNKMDDSIETSSERHLQEVKHELEVEEKEDEALKEGIEKLINPNKKAEEAALANKFE